MDLRLNKLDPDIVQSVNELTKSGKIHGKKQISINNNLNKNKHRNEEGKKFKNYLKEKYVVRAKKSEENHQEKNDKKNDSSKILGKFIDSRE